MHARTPRSPWPSLALAVAVVCASVSADIVHLRNGKTLRGEVVKEDDEWVVVKVPYGEVKLRTADVEGIERQTPSEYKIDLGRQLLLERQYDRAVRAFEEAYVANRFSADVQRVLANAYLEQARHYRDLNRYREAREGYEKLLKLDPGAKLVQHNAAADLENIKKQENELNADIEKARASAQLQEWTNAILEFERLLNLSPDARATVSADLALCYVGRAKERVQNKQTPQAAQDLEAALRLDPTLADKLEKFYTSCALPVVLSNLERGDLATAQKDLKRVLAFAPANRSVLYVAGRLCEAMNKLPEAADFYAHALGSRVENPTPQYMADLRKKLEALLDIHPDVWKVDTSVAEVAGFAKASDGPVEKLETDNFTVLHYNQGLAEMVAQTAEYHRSRILAELGFNDAWKGKVKIYIHRTQAEYTMKTGQPEWTGGCSRYNSEGGRIVDLSIHSWQTSPRLLKSVLPHEITHCVVYSNLPDPGNLPRALHEGFAVLMEPPYRQDFFIDFLRARIKSDDFLPLSDLIAARDYPRDPDFFYAEGFAIVDFLVQRHGMTETVKLIKDAKSSGYAAAELLQLSGAKSLEDLETDWKKWILKPPEIRPVVEKPVK